jgi:hypothetical protein
LNAMNLQVPEIFRLDAVNALAGVENGDPPEEDFRRLRDLLERELAGRARHRIRRANLLGLYAWLLKSVKVPITERLVDVRLLEQTIDKERNCLLDKVRARMIDRIDSNRRLWKSRILRQLTQSWGTGPLATILSLWSAGGNVIRSLILLRARTPTQALLAGGLALGQIVSEKWHERQASSLWASEADLGLTEADLARARSVLRGHLVDAEIELQATDRSETSSADLSTEQLAAVALQVYQRLEIDITEVIERRITRRAGGLLHICFEIMFSALPAYLLFHMGRNFFYEHLWLKAPLLGLDFLFQSAFWCILWAAAVGSVLLTWLNQGLEKELKNVVIRLSPERLFDALYAASSSSCTAIQRHAACLTTMEKELRLLEEQVGGVVDLGLGGLRSGAEEPSAARSTTTMVQRSAVAIK